MADDLPPPPDAPLGWLGDPAHVRWLEAECDRPALVPALAAGLLDAPLRPR